MGRNYKDIRGDKNPNYKGGHTLNKEGYYNTWQNMKQRCNNPNNPKYKNYGGRGIKICDEWLNIDGFAKWAINNGWKEGLTIDRIDNDGNYCPENCHWVSKSQNARKKSTTKISFKQAIDIRERCLNGECEHEIAKEYGVVHGTIWFIVNNFTHVEEMKCTKKLKKRVK